MSLLENHKIPVLPFKGPLLAASIYGNLSLRRISDLDILVHQQDFQKAADLLIAQGYEFSHWPHLLPARYILKEVCNSS